MRVWQTHTDAQVDAQPLSMCKAGCKPGAEQAIQPMDVAERMKPKNPREDMHIQPHRSYAQSYMPLGITAVTPASSRDEASL